MVTEIPTQVFSVHLRTAPNKPHSVSNREFLTFFAIFFIIKTSNMKKNTKHKMSKKTILKSYKSYKAT
jgi:hypothetical protein